MKVRALEPAEYSRLAAIEEGTVPDPANSIAIVAEDDAGNIVGRMLLFAVAHVERTWIAPAARSGTLGVRMERELCREATDAGLDTIYAFTTNDTHTEYMQRLGWQPTGFTVLTKSVKRGEKCQQ